MNKAPSLRATLFKLAEGSLTPNRLRHLLNTWPPLAAMGIRITHIADDWSRGHLELKLNRLNANMHGAAFGGTLFSMTDVLFGTLVMQRLGVDRYEAWTRTGSFDYIQPGRRGAYLDVEADDALIDRILAETEGGFSTVVPYTSVIRDRDGGIVGIGQQDLYVRARGIGKPPANPAQIEHVTGENLIAAGRTLARLGLRGPQHRERLTQHERMARRCIRPEARAVAWLDGVLELGDVSLDDFRAAGLPDVVIEALSSDHPGDAAMSLRAEVVQARESLGRY